MFEMLAQAVAANPPEYSLEGWKIFAASGGFVLGLINFGYLLYKEVLRKPCLKVHIESAVVRARREGTIDAQVVLRFSASRGSIYLLDVWIQYSEPVLGEYNVTNRADFNRAMSFSKRKLLDLVEQEFQTCIMEAMKTPVIIRDLHIAEDETRSLVFADRLITERLSDQYIEFPKDGWTLHVTHQEGHDTYPLAFSIHRDSNIGSIR